MSEKDKKRRSLEITDSKVAGSQTQNIWLLRGHPGHLKESSTFQKQYSVTCDHSRWPKSLDFGSF